MVFLQGPKSLLSLAPSLCTCIEKKLCMLIYYTTIYRPTNDYTRTWKPTMPILPNRIFVITTRLVLPLGTSNLVTFFSTRSFYSVIFVSNHTTIFWPCFVLLLCCQERIFIEIFLMRLLISISILSPNYIQNTILMFDEKDLQNWKKNLDMQYKIHNAIDVCSCWLSSTPAGAFIPFAIRMQTKWF